MSGEHTHDWPGHEHPPVNERLDAIEAWIAGQAPPPPEVSEPLLIEDDANFTISDKLIETAGQRAVVVRRCHDFHLDDITARGGSVTLIDCTDFGIARPSLDMTGQGNPNDWSDGEVGIFGLRCARGLVEGGFVGGYDSLVRFEGSEEIVLDGVHTLNPRGPFPRGQHVQFWLDGRTDTRNRQIQIRNHYALTDFSTLGAFQEDAFSIGHTDGAVVDNVLAEMIGASLGSSSGSGLMAEYSNDVHLDAFTTIGQANTGFGFNRGLGHRVENTLSVVPQGLRSNIGGYARYGAEVTFGANVRLYGAKPNGAWAAWWHSQTDGTVVIDLDRTIRGNSNSPEAAAELAAVVRP